MTDRETQRRLDRHAMQYLAAVDAGDLDAVAAFWGQAETDAGLAEALHALNTELAAGADRTAAATITAAVEKYLTGAEVVRPATGPVTVADVAAELFLHPPGRLPADAHALTDRLRTDPEPVPPDLGLTKFVAWAEARYGAAPVGYWKAFLQASIKLELRAGDPAEYGMAARRTPPKPGGPT